MLNFNRIFGDFFKFIKKSIYLEDGDGAIIFYQNGKVQAQLANPEKNPTGLEHMEYLSYAMNRADWYLEFINERAEQELKELDEIEEVIKKERLSAFTLLEGGKKD